MTVPAADHGLAALAGSSPDVGVIGYTLGGGLGWLSRRYGLAANSVTAAEVVTPDGRLARADAEHEPDLFWAVRGGGGGVGVVTALEMALFPVGEMYAGRLFFPIERSSEVLRAWREWTDTVPDEVSSLGRIMRFPEFPEVPEPMRGRAFALVEAAYLGDAVTGAEVLRPLRELGPELDTIATIAAPGLQTLHMDALEPAAADGDGAFLSDFPAQAIDAVIPLVGPNAETPLSTFEVRRLGGALARDAPDGGALSKIDAKFVMFAAGLTPTPEQRDAVRAHARALEDALTRGGPATTTTTSRNPDRGRRRPPARRLSPPARDQGELRPGPGDHLRTPGSASRDLNTHAHGRERKARRAGACGRVRLGEVDLASRPASGGLGGATTPRAVCKRVASSATTSTSRAGTMNR